MEAMMIALQSRRLTHCQVVSLALMAAWRFYHHIRLLIKVIVNVFCHSSVFITIKNIYFMNRKNRSKYYEKNRSQLKNVLQKEEQGEEEAAEAGVVDRWKEDCQDHLMPAIWS